MARSRETNTEGVGVGEREAATKNRQVRKGRQRENWKAEGGRISLLLPSEVIKH